MMGMRDRYTCERMQQWPPGRVELGRPALTPGGPDCSLLPRGAPPATLHAGVSWDRNTLGSQAEADGSQSTRGQGRVTVGTPAMPTPPLH